MSVSPGIGKVQTQASEFPVTVAVTVPPSVQLATPVVTV